MDAVYAFPGLILAMAISIMLGAGGLNTSIAIAIAYIPTYFRLLRSEVLSVKTETYVEAAKAIGARDIVILLRYVFPNVTSSMYVFASLNIADVILTAATLGFLGLGVSPPTPEWGIDINTGRLFLLSGHWWLVVFPGLMIILITVGFNFLGEGLNEILNPKLKEQ
jgi:peptide/nickel transport system permease protein